MGQGSAASDGPPETVGRISSTRADKTHHTDSSHILHTIRIVLSGVARMKGRFGKQMVARMLVGSKAKELAKYKLNSLSTFGLLFSLNESQVGSFIDALLSARLLQQVEERPHRPLVRLTPRGEEVMKGTASFDEPLALDDQLLLRLRAISAHPRQENRAPTAKSAATCTPAVSAKMEANDLDELNALLAASDDIPTHSEPTAASARMTSPKNQACRAARRGSFSCCSNDTVSCASIAAEVGSGSATS